MAAMVLAATRLLRGSSSWGRSRLRWAEGGPGVGRGPGQPEPLWMPRLWLPHAVARRPVSGLRVWDPGPVPEATVGLPRLAPRARAPSFIRLSSPSRFSRAVGGLSEVTCHLRLGPLPAACPLVRPSPRGLSSLGPAELGFCGGQSRALGRGAVCLLLWMSGFLPHWHFRLGGRWSFAFWLCTGVAWEPGAMMTETRQWVQLIGHPEYQL